MTHRDLGLRSSRLAVVAALLHAGCSGDKIDDTRSAAVGDAAPDVAVPVGAGGGTGTAGSTPNIGGAVGSGGAAGSVNVGGAAGSGGSGGFLGSGGFGGLVGAGGMVGSGGALGAGGIGAGGAGGAGGALFTGGSFGTGGALSTGGIGLDGGVPDGSIVDAAPDVPDAPPTCGDGIRSLGEACDDGNSDEADFCTAACILTDWRLFEGTGTVQHPAGRRYLGSGPHVAAANALGAAIAFVEPTSASGRRRVALLRADGSRAGDPLGIDVGGQHRPGPSEDMSVVALPGDRFAVAWTSMDADGAFSGVSIRRVDGATGTLGQSTIVNATTLGSQLQGDAVWTGTEVVVAWMDVTDPRTKVYYRRLDADLQPLGDETQVGEVNDSVPVLAAFAGDFAIGWVSRDERRYRTYRVKAGGVQWSVGPFYPHTEVRPRLEALDATHLVLVLQESQWLPGGAPPPLEAGVVPEYDARGPEGGFPDARAWEAGAPLGDPSTSPLVGRTWVAVLDVAAPGAVAPFRIEAVGVYPPSNLPAEHGDVALAVVNGSAFVGWRHETLGGSLVVKEMPWRLTAAGGKVLDLSLPEVRLSGDPARQGTGQRHPSFTAAPWTASGALLAVWEDSDKSFGPDMRVPDLVGQVTPLPRVPAAQSIGHDL